MMSIRESRPASVTQENKAVGGEWTREQRKAYAEKYLGASTAKIVPASKERRKPVARVIKSHDLELFKARAYVLKLKAKGQR
jgi:hypothetical protein